MVEITIRKRPRAEAAITQRKFFKKTAKGKVIKVLRERYLRDDVGCGVEGCRECTEASESTVPASGGMNHPSYPSGHIILPDTNIFLAQMDLIESDLFKAPIIVLQTVVEEVRHRSLPLYNRLKALLKADDKRIWVFYNEYRSETAIVREENETPNDRNDRGIRKATSWYNTHLDINNPPIRGQKRSVPSVVLVTDDAMNREKAKSEGTPVTSLKQYVEQCKNSTELLDLLAASGDNEVEPTRAAGGRPVFYPEYLPASSLLAGIKSQTLYQGHFNANQYNYLEGTVPVPAFTKPVLLIGRENMNRAVNGDVVVVEVFDEKEWKAPADEVIDQEATLRNDDAEQSDDEERDQNDEVVKNEEKALRQEAARAHALQERQPTGRIVGIIKRNWRAYVCHIDSTSLTSLNATSLSQQTVFATPVSRLLPRIRLRTRQAPTLLGQKILVTIDRWDNTSRYPEGHFVRALGKVESKEAEQESLLLEFDVPYRPFGKAILDCLPPEGDKWVVPPKVEGSKAWRDREDLRDMIICSIDPPDCQDIDDALHARRLSNGNIEAGVHIADVSNFVLPDNPMDQEAASRGTTVYLVDKRIDMLPALLGTNLCSLRQHVERFAFSVIWEMTPEGTIVNVRFTKSVIASKASFSYEEAQIRKDDPNLNDELTEGIRLLNSLAIKLKAARMAAGALNLASPEVKIHLDSSESSDPVDVEQKELHETNSLVEEFMLLANISVAQKIQETFPQTAVLRRHLPPPKTNFEKLQDILKKRKGMSLDVSSSGALAASLDKCVDPDQPSFNTLVRIMATRCMLSAEYFNSGSVGRDTFGHYGLASPIYTHFTSPIRRYADVLAHRQLSAAIGYTPLHASLHSKNHVERVLDVVNRRHRMAQMASRASVEFYVSLALKARSERTNGKVHEEAFVIRTFRNGLGVFVSTLGIEGLVMFKRDIEFDAENYTISVPSESGEAVKISVFDKVTVVIEIEKDRNTQRGKVKMTLLEPLYFEDLRLPPVLLPRRGQKVIVYKRLSPIGSALSAAILKHVRRISAAASVLLFPSKPSSSDHPLFSMPLEIVSRLVKSTELDTQKVSSRTASGLLGVDMLSLKAPDFIPITMWGYGRMERTSPGQGLATTGVASCTAVVFHCVATGRTVLSHSPNRLQMLTFIPMIDWVAGGTGEGLEDFVKRLMWKEGNGVSPGSNPQHVDVGVFRGFRYALPSEAARFGHAGWMSDFYQLCNEIKSRRSITFDIRDEHIVASGAISVDKMAGTVSLLELPKSRSKCAINAIRSPMYDSLYSSQRVARDIFIGNFAYSKEDVIDIHLQWDVNKFKHSIPLPDAARLFARDHSHQPVQGAEKALRSMYNLMRTGGGPGEEQVRMCLESCMQEGMPCERCNKTGSKRCSRCGGAWYCNKEHQEADWLDHKTWCKKHRLPAQKTATA